MSASSRSNLQKGDYRCVQSKISCVLDTVGLDDEWLCSRTDRGPAGLDERNRQGHGAIVAMAKKELPFDAAVVNASASTISGNLEKVKDFFPDGSFAGPPETWAKPEISQDRAGFDQARMKAHEAAVAMAGVAEESQLGAGLGALGEG